MYTKNYIYEQSRAEQSRAEQSRAEQSRAEQSRATKRVVEIDQLKGLCIFLVVLFHLFPYCFNSSNDLQSILSTIRMPIFFFLSGFVLKKTFLPITQFPIFLRNKFCRLLLPFFSIGLLYSYTHNHNFISFLTAVYKLGYWYLYALFIFAIIVFFFNYISDKLFKNKIILDIIIVGVLSALLGICYKFLSSSYCSYRFRIIDTTDIQLIFKYSVPFFFGFLVSKYNLTNLLFKKQLSFTISLLAFSILCYYHITNNLNSNFFTVLLLGMFAIVWVGYIFFSILQKDGYIMNKLAYIGTKTLDIYTLHYFILGSISLSSLQPFLSENGLIELILATILSIIIIAICIFVGHIIRQSRLLGFILLGQKYNR